MDELTMRFTHDVPLDFMLPGVPPTGRRSGLTPAALLASYREHSAKGG